MIYDNCKTEINIGVVNFKADNEVYGYVRSVEDTEKRICIDYAFDVAFKKGKLYHITYETTRLKIGVGKNSPMREDMPNKIFDCGWCRLVAVERIVSHDSYNGIKFIFKKIKSKNKR